MIKEEIKKIISKNIKNNFGQIDFPEFSIEQPKEASHGDYSTNVALILSKKLRKNPLEIAQKITGDINNKIFEKVEVANPGFINFYLKKEVFIENIKEVLKEKENFGSNKNLKNKKVIVEHTNVNPFKNFHIGHLDNNSIGESLSRIIEFHGAKVTRVTYQGDVGIHVARAIYAKQKNPNIPWDEAYADGTKLEEKNEQVKIEIREINKKIYERSDKEINKLYYEGKKWSLEYFDTIYKKLDTRFDFYFFESQIADIGKKIVEQNLGNVFERGEKGAVVFKGEKYGLHTRVFINSEGLPTYEAKELGLAKVKYGKYKYDQSVVVSGNEINEYFKVMLCAMEQVFPELAKKTKHIGHGMMRLPEGKMSSRTGNVVTFESLLNEVENLVKGKIHPVKSSEAGVSPKAKQFDRVKDRGFTKEEAEIVAEKVAIGALKYSILKQSIGSDIIYDFEKSISFEGDSGPYLQYSYARAQSVLRKAKAEKIKASFKKVPNEISQLEKNMNYFPEIVEKAGKEYEPHFIVLYLTELAREFNNYYAKNKIVNRADEFSAYKIALTEAFSIIMKQGLWLLGMHVVERM